LRQSRKLEAWLVGALLLGAAGLRTWRFDLAQVGYDESLVGSLIHDWTTRGLFPLTAGIVSNTDFRHPPAWTYLLGVALVPFNTPYAAVALGIVVGLVSVGLTWWIGRRWLGVWGGLAAAAFFAGSFWSTILGRSPWQPAFLAPAALLCLDALLLLAVKKRPWALPVACGWLALMAQVHYVAVAYVLLVPVAMWPARRVLRLTHLEAAVLAGLLPLVPFLIYELHPSVRLHEIGFLAGQAAGGSRVDLESWDLLWTLAGNGGAAGLGGPSVDGLRVLLGRWSSLGLLGVPLVAAGFFVAALRNIAGSQTSGWLLAAWVLLPVAALARHTLGVLFHYLYVDLPGMALAVGALFAWAATSRWRVAGLTLFGSALGVYVLASAATLVVVLGYLERADTHLGYGIPVRYSLAAGHAARTALGPGGQVLVGGRPFDAAVLRFSIGYDVPSRLFDDCQQLPTGHDVVYLLMRQTTPGAAALAAADAPLLGRVERPGDAYLVFGPPVRQPVLVGVC
jgi:hypothetical protein